MQKYFFSFINKFKIILFIISIIIIFKINFVIFNQIFIISSESMRPNYDIGDIVIIQNKSIQYNNSEVILFYPYGNHNFTPIIHRIQYFINKGEIMWLYGPIA